MAEKRHPGRIPWFVHLWPGAVGVFRHGRWSFLVLALCFGALLDAVLFCGYYWTELISTGERKFLWAFLGGSWGLMFWIGRILESRIRRLQENPDVDDTFQTALEHYLKGNWFETECCAHGLLRSNPRDAEAGLLLATLYRHTGRYAEAMAMIEKLQRYEESAPWSVEIDLEKEKLREVLDREFEGSTDVVAEDGVEAEREKEEEGVLRRDEPHDVSDATAHAAARSMPRSTS